MHGHVLQPDVGRLTQRDVPQAQALSAQVGWNQTEADWRRLLKLNPDGGIAVRMDGELVATSTLASYGERHHWIGMVIVHERFRGMGLGREVLLRALAEAPLDRGATIGLDATDQGLALYRSAGFEIVTSIDRWAGTLRPLNPGTLNPGTRAVAEGAADLAGIVALDRRASGVDRESLLRQLLGEEHVTAWVTRENGEISGYAVLRPGRHHPQLGPLVAAGRNETVALLNAAAAHLGAEPVLMDAPRNDDTAAVLQGVGLDVQRRLSRMSHGGRGPNLTGQRLRCAAGLEWG